MKKNLLTFLLSLVCMTGAFAVNEVTDYAYVVLWNADGTCNVYKCADRPMIIPEEENLRFLVNDTEVLFPCTEVLKITFSTTPEVDTAVEEVKQNACFDLTQNYVKVTGLDDAKMVSIYSSDGKRMLNAKPSNGEVTIDISHLKKGVYIVQCGKTNFKFLKK